ncbi:phosphoenolpyruvate--protein phosphotransferase [Magnetospirillum sulfuroxidans]|uniref:Phosphoenolpyruvate-protein phosphotransferase n=1 Tax=Magnetospirillum sulfuroxidans TaxID=611300 RepID=A0ABS5IE15_9PROT|nr:phosphoenolpyruvate--protein phosphotransferase [Magnetospirillum sulfuroxidans]MBR9971978.1 phosphoenolpyruvate--protein phosphotransferase [Magnetospirillum sulfuroxidans]
MASAELILEGMAVSRGIAIGVVYRHESDTVTVAEFCILPSQIESEKQRFTIAAEQAGQQVARLQDKARTLDGSAAEELGYLLDAYQQMLHGSRLIRGVHRRIEDERVNAEAAVQHEIDLIARGFEAMEDTYLAARVADIRDLGRRLIRNLTGKTYRPFQSLPRNAVIVAEDLTPADTALLDPRHVAGLATQLGGAESHTTIMARSLGLPAVLGVAGLLKGAVNGELIIIDGGQGRVIRNPALETLAIYRQGRARYLRERRTLSRLRDVPAITRDGVRLQLQANIELPSEIDSVLAAGAEGIGLFRSEFMYMNRDDLPSEDEQYQVMRTVVERMAGRPVTIRTLDVGGDKLAHSLGIIPGPNPALGLRAIRLSLARPELLDMQMAAILRASVHGPVRILVPMVATIAEVTAARAARDRAAITLCRAGHVLPDPLPPLGVMIEIPGAALSADSLARHADFFSIGTNDLTQYTLAIDRADEAVAHLYNPLHPAVLRLIQFTAEAANRAGIPVGVCGEVAGDPRYVGLLLGLGIHDLSMSATNIPVVKKRIRTLEYSQVRGFAQTVMSQSETARISQLLEQFNQDAGKAS